MEAVDRKRSENNSDQIKCLVIEYIFRERSNMSNTLLQLLSNLYHNYERCKDMSY